MHNYYTNNSSNLSNIIWEPKEKEDKIYNVYINPELESFIRFNKECYGSRKDFTYHYLYFYSTIWYLQNVDRRNEGQRYAFINYKTLVSVISREVYPEIFINSVKWNVIEENPAQKYHVGFYSKSYRLKEPFNTRVKRIPIADRLINRKINEHIRKTKNEVEKLQHSYQYLSQTNTFINMDVDGATKFNQINYFIQEPKKYDANFYSISEYSDRNYRFSVDTFGNRAHTNLTNLSTEFRQFLSVDGEPLGQVDISNSQPLFFYLHIKEFPFIPLSEKDNYRAIVESGRFYEYFMEKLKILAAKRNKVKSKILAAVFFDRNRKNESRYIKVFKQDFPKIAAYIKKLRKKDYKQLAKILQRTESKFIIEGVVAEFMKEFQENEFIATIHDSIVVKIPLLDLAKEIIERCFRAEDVNPKLKIEKFSNNTIQEKEGLEEIVQNILPLMCAVILC